MALQFFASFAVFYLYLQRLQLVFGFTALQSALALMPMVAGTVTFGLLGNWLAVRFHSLRFVLGGGILIAGIGMVLLGVVDYDVYWQSVWMIAICATGIGIATAPSTTAIMSNTPLDNQGVGSAVNDTARELGAAIGIALAGSILAAGYSSRITGTADLARDQLTAAGEQRIAAGDVAGGQALIDGADQVAGGISKSLAEATEVIARLPAEAAPLAARLADGAQQAFVHPMNQACVVLGSVLIVGAVVLFWFTPRRVVDVLPGLDDSGDQTGDQTGEETPRESDPAGDHALD